LRDVELINKRRINQFLSKATHWLWTLKDKRIGVLGLSFKPNTDDIRFAPAMELIGRLLQEHAQVRVYDPQAMAKTRELFPAIYYGVDPYEVAEGSEALMIVTEWESFRELDWPRIRDLMQRPLVLDGRNHLNGKEMTAMGFEYQGVGVSPAETWGPEAAQRTEVPQAQKLRH